MMFGKSLKQALAGAVVVALSLAQGTCSQSFKNAESSPFGLAAETLLRVKSATGSSLFDSERVQLTDRTIARLIKSDPSLAGILDFDTEHSISSEINSRGNSSSDSCKNFPGQPGWPTPKAWGALYTAIGGALISTVPSAASCYNDWTSERSAADCDYVTSVWSDSHFHMEDPTSVMSPLFQGRTCMPTTNPNATCTRGGYPIYVVNVTTVAQIQLAVNFARNQNVRLVVKNTGHDFLGKSAGAGALSVWTHHLKDLEYIPKYKSKGYKGPAVRIGAGVQVFELYAAGKKHGFTAVGGEGRTVGIAGGYLAGGGHSPLSSIYGIAADHVLELEVVTADGNFTTANSKTNSDLFWALCGGGGSTFGIVTSYTLKVYPVIPVTVATFSYSTSNTVNADAFWAGFRAYLNYFPANTDAGTYAYFTIFPTGPGGFVFGMTPFFAPDLTISQTQALLAPWLDDLATLGINITPQYSHFDNYHDAWDASFPLEPMGGSNQRAGARLFPKANWANETILNATYSAIRTTVEEAGGLIAFQIKAAPASGFPDNAVNPAWRQTLLHAIVSVSFADQSDAAIGAASKKMETDYVQRWRDVSPGAGAYFNEASPDERDWQQSFWGTKYPKLYQIKQKVDPKSVFYATTAVGSEDWYVTNQTIPFLTQQTGQLCRK